MDVYVSIQDILKDRWNEKLYYKKRTLDGFPLTKKVMSRPLMLHIETTNICNHNCIFCAYEHNKSNRSIMPFSLFKKVINDYLTMGGGLISLTPSPGEVLLDKNLKERPIFLNKKNKISGLSITTNGLGAQMWNDEDLQYIISNFDRIHFSIYGFNSDEYSQITRKDSYSRCVSEIKRIISYAKDGSVCFGFRLLNNRTEEEIARWIRDNMGMDYPFGYTTEYCTWGSLLFNPTCPLPRDATWKEMPIISGPCMRPLITIKVGVDGEVTLCVCSDGSAKDLVLGSITTHSLEELFNSKSCKNFWDSGSAIPESCRKCTAYISINELQENWVNNPFDYIGG